MVALFLWLLVMSLFDIRYRKVPVWLLMTGGVAVAIVGIYGCVSGERGLAEFLLGMIPGLFLLLLAAGTRKAGWADGIVLIYLGSVMGLGQCIAAAMLSLVMISVWSILLLIMRKADKGTRIPYVPFLTMGYGLCVIIFR